MCKGCSFENIEHMRDNVGCNFIQIVSILRTGNQKIGKTTWVVLMRNIKQTGNF